MAKPGGSIACGFLIAAAAAAAACGDDGQGGPPGDGRQTVVDLPATVSRDLDLLFVIDDSASTIDKQQLLAASLPALVARLNALPGGLPNLHAAVVSTDMGTSASTGGQPAPAIGQVGQGGCAARGKAGAFVTGTVALEGTFLFDLEAPGGGRMRNYGGDLAATLGGMFSLGAAGCGFEQPLAAMRAALDNHPSNVGFLRPSARLGVVFMTDEDDCSANTAQLFAPSNATIGPLESFRCTRFGVTCAVGGDMTQVGAKSQCTAVEGGAIVDGIEPYRAFLAGLKADPQHLLVAGIMPPPEPFQIELRAPPGGGNPQPALAHNCTVQTPSGISVGDPAVRLQAFLDGFPGRTTSTTICQTDASAAFERIGSLVDSALGSPCVTASLADLDPVSPGLQPDCRVDDRLNGAATPIDACGETPAAPCWRLVPDAATCPDLAHLKLDVVRTAAPDPDTHTVVRCFVN